MVRVSAVIKENVIKGKKTEGPTHIRLTKRARAPYSTLAQVTKITFDVMILENSPITP